MWTRDRIWGSSEWTGRGTPLCWLAEGPDRPELLILHQRELVAWEVGRQREHARFDAGFVRAVRWDGRYLQVLSVPAAVSPDHPDDDLTPALSWWTPAGERVRQVRFEAWRPAPNQHPIVGRVALGPRHLAWSPDGATIAALGGEAVWLWSWPFDGQKPRRIDRPDACGLIFAPDGQLLVWLWRDLVALEPDGAWRLLLRSAGGVEQVAASDEALALATRGGGLLLTDRQGQRRAHLVEEAGPMAGVALSADGRRLAAGGRDTRLYLFARSEAPCVQSQLEARLRARPEDRASWLVYADWLAERGDPRGELVHLEYRQEDALCAEERAELQGQIDRLLDRHRAGWLEGCALPEGIALSWRRGSVHEVRFRRADRLPEALDALEVLGTLPVGRWMCRLSFDHLPLGDEGAELLSRSAALRSFERLSLVLTGLTDRGAMALARSPHLGALAELRLGSNAVGEPGALALASSAGLRSLSLLDLRGDPISDEARARIARSAPPGCRIVWSG